MDEFNKKMANLKTTLMTLQNDLDAILTESENLTQDKTLPIKFFNKANSGVLVSCFSDLSKCAFDFQAKLKAALDQDQKKEESSES